MVVFQSLKLNYNLEIEWGKAYYTIGNSIFYSSINKNSTGNLIMGFSGSGAYPTVLAEIDSDGNILSQKGYPNFTPKVETLSDGSMVLESAYTFDSTGQTYQKAVIAKTDSSGEIDGCQTYTSCLRSE